MKQLIAILLCVLAWPVWAADCVVGVYGGVPGVTGGPVQVALTLLDTFSASNVSTSTAATSATSTTGALPTGTLLLRVKCNGIVHFLISDDGTNVTTADQSMAAYDVEYFGAVGGQRIKFINGT